MTTTRLDPRFLSSVLLVATAILVPNSASAAFDPGRMRNDQMISGYSYGFAFGNVLRASDLDGDGVPEIVGADEEQWFSLGWQPSADRFSRRFTASVLPGPSGDYYYSDIGDLDGDGRQEMVVVQQSGAATIFDALSGRRMSSYRLNGSCCVLQLELADVEPGGGDELVVVAAGGLSVFLPGATSPLWSLPVANCTYNTLGVGNIDADPALELVLSGWDYNGVAAAIVDNGTRSIEWTFAPGFDVRLDVGDITGDGRDEIVAARYGAEVFAVDGLTRTVMWSQPGGPGVVRVVDIDGDGISEVLTGDGLRGFGFVQGYHGATGDLLFRLPSGSHDVAAIDAADVDADCEVEVIWAAGVSGIRLGTLFVADPVNQEIEWTGRAPWTKRGVTTGDLDGDGRIELLNPDSDHLHVVDLQQAVDQEDAAPPNGLSYGSIAYATTQLDADLGPEYLLTENDYTVGVTVVAFDGLTHQRQWTSPTFRDESETALTAGDLDSDGIAEVIFSTQTWSVPEAIVRVLSGADGSLLWERALPPTSTDTAATLRIADVDSDRVADIIFGQTGVGVYVWDGVTKIEKWYLPEAALASLEVGDVNGDLVPDIVVGTSTGELSAFDGRTLAPLFQSAMGNESIMTIRMGDLDGDTRPEMVLVRRHDYHSPAAIQVIDPAARTELWRSESLSGFVLHDSAFVADADDDSQIEIGVATTRALHLLEYDRRVADTTPPAFTGAVGLQGLEQASLVGCCPSVDLTWSPARDDLSPPVTYRVYRDTHSGFTPTAANLMARPLLTSWRDSGVAAGTTYYYVVRAVDAAGNEDDNVVERTVLPVTADVVPGPQGNVLHAFRDGTDVRFSFPSAAANAWRLFRDSDKQSLGRTQLPRDVTLPSYVDLDRVLAPGVDYYQLAGVSECSRVAGP